MKYMHFNSSCPYAGVANLLELQGMDKEDYKIALEMNLPYFLRRDVITGYYQSGSSLQSAEWFDLYLNHLTPEYRTRWLSGIWSHVSQRRLMIFPILMRRSGRGIVCAVNYIAL